MDANEKNAMYDLLNQYYSERFLFPKFMEEQPRADHKVTLICPIHGEITNHLQVVLNDDSICPSCEPFKVELIRKYGPKATEEEFDRLYRFAYRNSTTMDRTSSLSNYDKSAAMYKRYQETPDYKAPKPIAFRHRRTPKEAEADLRTIFRDAYDYPYIEKEFTGTKANITAVCPVHGEFITNFNRMYENRGGCRHCGPLRSALSVQHGTEVGFIKFLEYYTSIRNKIDGDTSPAKVVTSTIDTTNNIQPDESAASVPTPTTNPSFTSSSKCNQYISEFRALRIDDISHVNIDIDVKSGTEIVTIFLNNETQITITHG